MPKWGLTPEMLDARPWGLSAEVGLLAPAKVITDPVHGDIYLNRLELLVVDSRPFQRLRRVRQLGLTLDVYPGATNTRFSHSLGALRAAQNLLDIVLDQRHYPHGVNPDLFAEWEHDADDPDAFPRGVGQVVAVARLGALLHDLAHIPFGHSIEDDLGILPAHDKGSDRFEHLWLHLGRDLEADLTEAEFKEAKTLIDGPLAKELRPVILSKEKVLDPDSGESREVDPEKDMTYPFVADLVGDTICADLIDYLPRDHLFSGLPMAVGHRFLDAFFVTTDARTRYRRRMALSIVRENRERPDIISELLKYLRYRYELTERVLVHHAKLAADAMVGKALELWFEELQAEIEAKPQDTTEEERAHEPPGETPAAAPDAKLRAVGDEASVARVDLGGVDQTPRDEEDPPDPLEESPDDDAPTRARKRLETRILLHGDDGLLEYLRDWSAERQSVLPIGSEPARVNQLRELVRGLLERRLFRHAGQASNQQASAAAIYRDHGKAAARRKLEAEAAEFAGIDDPWKICIWLPPPEPRLKSAEVLVYNGGEVVEFYRSEQYKGQRGEDIYAAHKRLWAVSVYMHRSVCGDQRQQALVRLAQRMELRWDREAKTLGDNVLEWPERLVARNVCEDRQLGREAEERLLRLARKDKVARGPDDISTYDGLRASFDELAKTLTY